MKKTADLFIDCEWSSKTQELFILGAYSYGQDRFQLCDDTIDQNRFTSFLDTCSKRGNCEPLLFVHGPDIAKIEDHFDTDLRHDLNCINTQTAFRRFTDLPSSGLKYLEKEFGLSREHDLNHFQINAYWGSKDLKKREIVLDYNWEDCVNLWKLVKILEKDFGVTREDLINEARLH